MGIVVNYQVDPLLSGALSFLAGRGLYRQRPPKPIVDDGYANDQERLEAAILAQSPSAALASWNAKLLRAEQAKQRDERFADAIEAADARSRRQHQLATSRSKAAKKLAKSRLRMLGSIAEEVLIGQQRKARDETLAGATRARADAAIGAPLWSTSPLVE